MLRGNGVAIMARERWSSVPLDADAIFVDALDIASLRVAHPQWRATSLAPVSRVEPPLMLGSVADYSIGYIVAFSPFAGLADVNQLCVTARRALRPGGILVLAVPDERYVDAANVPAKEAFASLSAIEEDLAIGLGARCWTAGRLAFLIETFLRRQPMEMGMDIDLVGRVGMEAVVILRITGPEPYLTGDLLEVASRVFVADGRFMRHVQNPAVLQPLMRGGRSVRTIGEHEMVSLVVGRPLRQQDVEDLIRRRDAAA